MDKPLIITVCPTGGTFTKRQNPLQPYTPREIADQTIGAYKEGATVFHVHTRNEDGTYGAPLRVIKEIVDMVFEECPDMIFALPFLK